MADEITKTEQTDSEPQGTEEPQGTDWKAMSRKWESQAKANLEKAKAYDELVAKQREQEPTLKALQEEVTSLKDQAKKAKAEAERQSLLNSVSSATGVPASLIQGATEEEMTASAQSVLNFAKSKNPQMPEDKGGGASTKPITADEITKIKDPIARVRARATLISNS